MFLRSDCQHSFMTPCDVEKLFVVGYREYLSSEQCPMDGHVWVYILAWVQEPITCLGLNLQRKETL